MVNVGKVSFSRHVCHKGRASTLRLPSSGTVRFRIEKLGLQQVTGSNLAWVCADQGRSTVPAGEQEQGGRIACAALSCIPVGPI